MKKNKQMSKKARQERRAKIIIIAFLAVVILVVALALVQKLTQEETVQYIVTEDGQVHTASGAYVGTIAEIFGEGGLVVTEEGHVHAADGTHLGEINVPGTAEENAAE